jgi:putative phage-type endonuclease
MIQGSEEWIQARLGKVTASRVADVVRKTKSGPAASRANYMAELISERLTGSAAPSYVSQAMQWGTETEAAARAAYEFMTDKDVTEVGFIDHPILSMCGGSPDGLVPLHGIVEFKCPLTATHLDYLDTEEVPRDYLIQMHWNMACTSTKYGHFVSFDPRLPPAMQLLIINVTRDDQLLKELTTEVKLFLNELEFRMNGYCERFRLKPKVLAA